MGMGSRVGSRCRGPRGRWHSREEAGAVERVAPLTTSDPTSATSASCTPADSHSPGGLGPLTLRLGAGQGPGLTTGRCCQALRESPFLELVLDLGGVPGHTVGL